ncbi:MAG: 6-bladed beta-propeller [Oryzomonas sp.]|uniref:6-bladed beta-propeller n=1 Tax=Oryzomonas sp. TaxID=2855186 RepID=UPI002850003E|nr:6-bladed beta-propeller [Oryzomonas sp.]MDR3578338.1 6-bladed beta-propeller [Oryzomonas sp.]
MALHIKVSIIAKTVIRMLLIVCIGAALAGCAQKLVCSTKPTFFPPAPDEPHIQYLTGITNSKDVGEKASQSSFSLVVTGNETQEIIRKIGKSFGIVAYKGKLYVAESAGSRVVIIDPVAGTFDYPRGMSTPKGALKEPINLAFDQDGYMYVADTGRKQVVVYNPAGDYAREFSFGIESKIVSVAIYGGKLYALDLGTSRIRVLDRKTGEELSVFGYSETPNQSLRAPGNFAIDSDGAIYVSNIGNNKVMKFDIDGNFLQAVGGAGDQPGQFARPKGVAVDDAKRLYVVDAGLNVVHLFDDKSRLLTFFGWPGLETGSLSLPAGIAVTKDNLQYFQKYAVPGFQLESLIFVVNQFGQNMCIPRISVYGLGEMKK